MFRVDIHVQCTFFLKDKQKLWNCKINLILLHVYTLYTSNAHKWILSCIHKDTDETSLEHGTHMYFENMLM